MNPQRIVASVCALKEHSLDDAVATLASLGFTQMECFSRWTASALDESQPAEPVRARIESRGLRLHSLHLPPIADESSGSFLTVMTTLQFAADLGARQVVFPAKSLALYVRTARAVLDTAERLGLTVTVEIHSSSTVSSLASALELFRLVPDPRLKVVLEVGHLHKAGDHWRDAWTALAPRVAVVHLKDIREGKNVPFGQGEIDLTGLVAHLRTAGYPGNYVIEILVPDRENSVRYLREAREWLVAQPD